MMSFVSTVALAGILTLAAPLSPQAHDAPATDGATAHGDDKIDETSAPGNFAPRRSSRRRRGPPKPAPRKIVVPFEQIVRELTDAFVADFEVLAGTEISPLAIASVEVSSNLSVEAAQLLNNALTSALHKLEGIRQVYCAACVSVRSRVDGNQWVVTEGITSLDESRRIAAELGIRSYLFATLDVLYESAETAQEAREPSPLVSLSVRAVRANSGLVVFANRYMSNETDAARRRDGKPVLSKGEEEEQIVGLLAGTPEYVSEVYLGSHVFPNETNAVSLGYGIGEVFGYRQQWSYGFVLEPHVTTSTDSGKVGLAVRAGVGYTFSHSSPHVPRIRLGINTGVLFGEVGIPNKPAAAMAPQIGPYIDLVTHIGIGVRASLTGMFLRDEPMAMHHVICLLWKSK